MYVWQFYIDDEPVIVGRTWSQFVRILKLLNDSMQENERIICFVHNLSYEFQYLKSVLTFDEVYCLDERKVLKAVSEHIEFRCSYMQTNQPLSAFTRDYNAVHVKLSGDDYDYTVQRFPWSRLSDDELSYCVNDVVGLVEAMKNRAEAAGDTWNTLPLTNTGYVRRDVKRAMRNYYKPALIEMQPDIHLYGALRGGFRGGDVHGNRYYVGIVLNDVFGRDITSAYPYAELARLYPMSKFVKSDESWTIDDIRFVKHTYNKAFLIRVAFKGVRLANEQWGFPYIPIAKSYAENYKNDNGRILRADYVEMWLTDIDLEIIEKEYTYTSAEVLEVYIANYGKLPKQITDIIYQLFKDKSTLKGVEGSEMQYALKKSMLNSVYGLTAQDVGKLSFMFNGTDIVLDTEKSLETILNNARKNPYLAYQWGVWCTAHARKRLHMGLWAVVEQGATPVYVDTDSIKYIGDVDWTEVNEECYRVNYSAVTNDGKETVLGTFVDEGCYKKFLTYGAKKYAYVDQKDKLHITIAGVSKKKGAEELAAAGGIEALREGFTFKKAAGAEAHYNDHELQVIRYRGHNIELASNVALTESEYTLGLTSEYENVIYDGRAMAFIKAAVDLLFETGV